MGKFLNFGLAAWGGYLVYYYSSKVVDVVKFRSHSMEPFVNLGDWVWIDRIDEEYEGNLIAYNDTLLDRLEIGYVVADEGEWVVKKESHTLRKVPKGHVFMEHTNVPLEYYSNFVPKSSIYGVCTGSRIPSFYEKVKDRCTHRKFENL